jgi:hypothetical protein
VNYCLEPLLQAIQQARRTLASSNSSSLTAQAEQCVLDTLGYALAAFDSRRMKDCLTAATLPVLLGVLRLPKVGSPLQLTASNDNRVYFMRRSSRASKVREAQDIALPILKRFCHNTAGRQAFAAAGGITVLVERAEDASLFYGSDRSGLALLCSLEEDPEVAHRQWWMQGHY